ncbi:MAG TPA: hypothetical protein VLH40_03255 [Atribacteraceae bacterium]|nr:hypothetical protein [Atribacteraceae bacterium]
MEVLKATFPHLAHLDIALGFLYPTLGVDIVPPPPISKKTIELGVKLAPQNACFPLKVTLGNFLEGIEQGADTVFMVGGVGPCRFGYYGEIQKVILEDMGHRIKFVLLDHPRYGFRRFLDALRSMTGGRFSFIRAKRAAILAWRILRFTEELEGYLRDLRARTWDPQQLETMVTQSLHRLRQVSSPVALDSLCREVRGEISLLPKDNTRDHLRVGIVGEVYVAQERRINFDVERLLGSLGVRVHNSVSTVEYLLHALPFFKSTEKLEAWRLARPYLNRFIGGEGIDSVGSTVRYAHQGYDGVVHLYPFTCMPEVVAKGIMGEVGRDYDLPLLHLAIDEHAGEAGLVTRVEAFVDVLERRRKFGRKKLGVGG